MGYEPARQAQKAGHVRQFGMRIKRGFVNPLGVNIENQWIAERFIEMNADAPGFGARRLEEQRQLFAKLLLFPTDWFEADKSVERQNSLPLSIVYVGPTKRLDKIAQESR